MRSVLCGILILCMACTALAQSPPSASVPKEPSTKAISPSDLQGKTIHTLSGFSARFRNEKGETRGGFTLRREIKIGAQAAVHVTFTREIWWESPNGRQTNRTAGSDQSTIGVPMQASGARLFVLQGNTLTMLRVHDIGGHVLKVHLQKSAGGFTCSAQSVMAREVGSGTTKNTFGSVEIWDTKPISSSCKVEATK